MEGGAIENGLENFIWRKSRHEICVSMHAGITQAANQRNQNARIMRQHRLHNIQTNTCQ